MIDFSALSSKPAIVRLISDLIKTAIASPEKYSSIVSAFNDFNLNVIGWNCKDWFGNDEKIAHIFGIVNVTKCNS